MLTLSVDEKIQIIQQRISELEKRLVYQSGKARLETLYQLDGFRFAVSAMEKANSVPVKKSLKRGDYIFTCPCCNHFQYSEAKKGFDQEKHDFSQTGYCEKCGQKLDWTEADNVIEEEKSENNCNSCQYCKK